ncbi:MAG: metal ABC transporter permease [Verrucomicrobia bacterium]|nr:metal ABC transporter permease [Verrucomicrobiota bacterium]
MNNPYAGSTFGEFFLLFFQRIGQILFGQEMLASDEVQVLVLSLVALSSVLVGSFLVLKKMAMLANSLSHTVLLGIVIAYILLIPLGETPSHAHAIGIDVLLIASLLTGLMTTLLTQGLTHLLKLQVDASTGLVFTTLFALGVVLVTVYTRNAHIGIEAIMGNVDALHVHDLKLIAGITLFDALIITLFYKEFKLTAFDAPFGNAIGFSSNLLNYLLMFLTSLTVIGAFRAVGVLLVLCYLVGPVLAARLLTHRLKYLLFIAGALGIGSSLISVALSRHLLSVYHLPVSTAGLSVTVLGTLFLAIALAKQLTRRLQSGKFLSNHA